MPDVAGFTEAELAERAGTTLEQVHRIRHAGVIEPDLDGTYGPGAIQRIRVAEACDRAGIPLDDIGRAVETGHLSFSFLDLVFSKPVANSDTTYEQACAQYGWTFDFVERIHEALGLPPRKPEDRIREDDLIMFPMAAFVLAAGLEEAGVLRALRVYAENLARIAQAEAQFYHSYIETPLLSSGMTEMQMLQTAAQLSPQLQQMVNDMLLWVYRRHQEYYIIEHVIEHVEQALDDAGFERPRVAKPPAMVFLDLAGYTRLTEERGDEAAAELAASLAGLVQRESRTYGGRPVKWLGDGVMFHFPDPAAAVECSLELVDRTPAAGLPPAHVGVNAGPVVFRDGDYYGRTVNVAARIASRATAGEVLVSDDVVAATDGGSNGLAYEELGPVELKGLIAPVRLHRALRA